MINKKFLFNSKKCIRNKYKVKFFTFAKLIQKMVRITVYVILLKSQY